LTARFTKKAVTPWKPDITFFCPIYAEPWGPWRILQHGTGGSEEAVIYLAREFAHRGLNVQVFAPLDQRHRGVHVEHGVRWRDLDALDMVKTLPGIVIAHRSPSAVRLPCFAPERLYVWHQDAAYHGEGTWTVPIAQATRSLFVSRWQEAVLLRELQLTAGSVGIVCGNGIPDSCFDRLPDEERDPLSCVYASSPLRGLEALLDAWPTIHTQVPGAKVQLYYGWETAAQVPAVNALRNRLMLRIRELTGDGVVWRGRVPQLELEKEMRTQSVWIYPCMFQEGFAIAGVRAAAAGMIPVYRKVAALEECQYPSSFAVTATSWLEGGREEFITAAVAALHAAQGNTFDRALPTAWAKERHTWGHVAARILTDFKAQNLV